MESSRDKHIPSGGSPLSPFQPVGMEWRAPFVQHFQLERVVQSTLTLSTIRNAYANLLSIPPNCSSSTDWNHIPFGIKKTPSVSSRKIWLNGERPRLYYYLCRDTQAEPGRRTDCWQNVRSRTFASMTYGVKSFERVGRQEIS